MRLPLHLAALVPTWAILAGAPLHADVDPRVARFNSVVGTQTFGVKYGFTDQTRLVETAQAILDLGSNILKLALGAGYTDQYALPADPRIHSLKDQVELEPSYRRVLDLPFTYYLLWAYGFHGAKWQDGVGDDEAKREYDEIYALTRYLLLTYQGTGKVFYLGHWEGDWHLHPGYDPGKDPTPTILQGMIDWLNTRQRAVDDAKRDTPHEGVEVWQYTEVNLVQKALKGGITLTNNVLPSTHVDYVSYSAYDSLAPARREPYDRQAFRRHLCEALDYLESKLPPKPGVPGKRVWIGEYGFPLSSVGSPERQDRLSRETAAIALEWGCPFVLYWELYCNEIGKDGRHRGFWLIDDQGVKQPLWHSLHGYFDRSHSFVQDWLAQHGEVPHEAEFRRRAVQWLRDGG